MSTPSPFSILDDAFGKIVGALQPPDWAIREGQRRIVLLLNHVIQQEPEAMARLGRMKGRVAQFQWREFGLRLKLTPAGLLDLADGDAPADLAVALTQDSPSALVQGLVQGNKPAVRIEGDVQLAAEINWLVDHLRWDIEEDLARLVGDAPAHALGQAVATAVQGMRSWVARATERLRPGAPE